MVLFLAHCLYAVDTLHVVGVGDIMLGTDYPSKKYLPPNDDCSRQLRDVQKYLQEADVTFGNLECSIAGGFGDPKECKDTTKCYVFRMPLKYMQCITESGFDLLSTANNHANDFGETGRRRTIEVLDSLGIGHAGDLSKQYHILDIGGTKIGFCAFAPNKGTLNSKDYELVKEILTELKQHTEVIIVSIHTGAEGKNHQHLPKTDEVYLGYNRGNVYEFAHLAVDHGADVVFGHGPHVTRAAELYKDRFIAYSLGNFSTYARFNLRGPNGLAPLIQLQLDKLTGAFIAGKVISTKQIGEGITMLDATNGALHKLRELTESDFPAGNLLIKDDGTLLKK